MIPPSSTQKYIAGNIRYHIPQWSMISQDSWIQEVVTGYTITFVMDPPRQISCPAYHMIREQEEALDQEIRYQREQ